MQGARGLLCGEGDHEVDYMEKEIMEEQLTFGAMRNDFGPALKELKKIKPEVTEKGRKEIRLSELTKDQKLQFTGPGGSDDKEWQAWLSFQAVEVIT